tara:strand:+ start:6432 stop:8660 length:2229 start_codon:yes stop_codon:yes gene_type:complete
MSKRSNKNVKYLRRDGLKHERKLFENYFYDLIQNYGVDTSYFKNDIKFPEKVDLTPGVSGLENLIYGEAMDPTFYLSGGIPAYIEIENDVFSLTKFGLQPEENLTVYFAVNDFNTRFASQLGKRKEYADQVSFSGYTLNYQPISAYFTSTASGTISALDIVSSGNSYFLNTSTPSIAITPPFTANRACSGTLQMPRAGFVNADSNSLGMRVFAPSLIRYFEPTEYGTAVLAGGTYHSSVPTLSAPAPTLPRVNATASTTVDSGIVTSITVTHSGSYYTTTPSVTIAGGGGTGASASAVVGRDPAGDYYGSVSAISIINSGAGYTSTPTLSIGGPTGTTKDFTATLSAVMEFGDRGRVIRPILVTSGHFYDIGPNVNEWPNGGPNFNDMFLGPKPSITTKTASATLHTLVDGRLTGYTITDGGSGYMETKYVPWYGRTIPSQQLLTGRVGRIIVDHAEPNRFLNQVTIEEPVLDTINTALSSNTSLSTKHSGGVTLSLRFSGANQPQWADDYGQERPDLDFNTDEEYNEDWYGKTGLKYTLNVTTGSSATSSYTKKTTLSVDENKGVSIPVNPHIARSDYYNISGGSHTAVAIDTITIGTSTYSGSANVGILYYDQTSPNIYNKNIAPEVGDFFRLSFMRHRNYDYEITNIADRTITPDGINPLLGKYVWKCNATRRYDSYETISINQEEETESTTTQANTQSTGITVSYSSPGSEEGGGGGYSGGGGSDPGDDDDDGGGGYY